MIHLFRIVVAAGLLSWVGAGVSEQAVAGQTGPDAAIVATRPRMFISSTSDNGLRSVEDVRAAIRKPGRAADLWAQLKEKVESEMVQAPWTPATPMPGRSRQQVELGNRDFGLVALTANRILDAALVGLIEDDRQYADAALRQIAVLFDEAQWSHWDAIEMVRSGRHVSLRTGQLVVPVAVAYDWLYDLLSAEERAQILEGLNRRAIQPFKRGVEAEEMWTRSHNNWLTVIVGGFGIAAMALGEDHPDSDWVLAFANPRMEHYPHEFGADGSFNESVQYAGSTINVVRYFMARRYATGGMDNPFARHSLADFTRWYMYMTFPPGRVAGFGDPSAQAPPVADHLSAVAAAMRDPLVQWFYLQYADLAPQTHRSLALELLYYDDTLDPLSPEGRLPLGRAYHHEGKLVSSRSGWDPNTAVSVAYGKASRERSHSHADWGQLCVDGYGERLVIDLGSPPGGYPRSGEEYDYFYNFQQWGHNIFVFGEHDTGGVPWRQRDREGYIRSTDFDDTRGASWTIDLSEVYDSAKRVARQVVHRLPRVVAVLDSAELAEPQAISLRWHLAEAATPDEQGRFSFTKGQARLVGRVVRLDGEATLSLDRHAYKPPYDKDRLDIPYPQRHEPFINIVAKDRSCRILTLFCVEPANAPAADWRETGDGGWAIDTQEGVVTVHVVDGQLVVK